MLVRYPRMAYRRPNDEGVFGSRWRIAHRSRLADCGIPSAVAEDDRRWAYVLNHGHDLETGWETSWLSEKQAKELLSLLEPQFRSAIGIWLVETFSGAAAGVDNQPLQRTGRASRSS